MTRCSAIILAAGKGTRMRSDLPKVLHTFRGEPLVCHPLRAARTAGADPVVLVVGFGGDAVRTAALASDGGGGALRFAEQTVQHGTGHAVGCGLVELDATGPVLILSGDVPLVRASTLVALVDACIASTAGLALAVFTPPNKTGYGRILRDADNHVIGIREERDTSPQEHAIADCNAGTYCVDADLLREVLPTVRRNNSQGEIYLTDIVAPLAARGHIGAVRLGLEEAAGVNTPEDLLALESLARDA